MKNVCVQDYVNTDKRVNDESVLMDTNQGALRVDTDGRITCGTWCGFVIIIFIVYEVIHSCKC